MKSPFKRPTTVRRDVPDTCAVCDEGIVRRKNGRWVHKSSNRIHHLEPEPHDAQPTSE